MNRKNKEQIRIRKKAMGIIAALTIDIIKLVFAGVILGGIMDLSLDKSSLFLLGTAVIVLLFVFWYLTFVRSERKD